MSRVLDEAWSWLKTAPLPVVLAITLSLAAWVYAIDAAQAVEKVRVDGVRETVGKMDGKLDTLLQAVADLKAEQRASRYRLPAPAASPAPKEK